MFKIEFTQQELNIVAAGLARLPYGDVSDLMESVKRQYAEQLQPVQSQDTQPANMEA